MRARGIVGMVGTAAAATMVVAMVSVVPAGAATAPTVTMASPTWKVGSTFHEGDYDHYQFGEAATEVFSWTVSAYSSPVCSQRFDSDHHEDGVYSTAVAKGKRSFTENYELDQYGQDDTVTVTFCNGISVTSNVVTPYINAMDDLDPTRVSYFGAWSVSTCKCAIEGTTHYSTQKNASFSFRVSGAFGLAMSKAPNRGSAAIYVDGTKTAVINTYASTAINATFVYSVALKGKATHTVSVVNLATAGHPRIDVDAIAVHY
jgi:hypothetical protein